MPTTERLHSLLCLGLLALLLALPLATRAQTPPAAIDALPGSDLRIGVMTMQPGEVFWERFGHDAIVVVDPRTGTATSYNYGFFDPDEPGFLDRFVRGKMQYLLAALPVEQDLASYRDEGRGVSIQWLDLTPAQASRLQHALQVESQPENARYHYDYFTANCATKVRDALDDALGGELHRKIAGQAHGQTYRSEAVRLASPATWMWLGFDIGLSSYADQPLSRWDDAFIPMRLADSLATMRLGDGRPLVASTQVLLPHRITAEPQAMAQPWWPWALIGLALALAIWWAGRHRPRTLAAIALPLWLVLGTFGSLLLFVWGFTDHRAAWANQNLLLLSPLCLLLVPGGWHVARGHMGGRWFRVLLAAVATGTIVALLLKWMPMPAQLNQPWIALLLPIHLALWHALGRHTQPAA